jgi:hypothetical protein
LKTLSGSAVTGDIMQAFACIMSSGRTRRHCERIDTTRGGVRPGAVTGSMSMNA